MNEIETFYGLVENTLDALRIFQMCREGRLHRVRRRLHERERRLIRSGSVFVFDEEESGIRRWTDGRLWSPSRILGNFLIYRELEKKGKGGMKQNSHGQNITMKRSASSTNISDNLQRTKIPKILPKAAESLDMLWGIPRGEQCDHIEEEGDFDFEYQQQFDSGKGINPQELLSPPTPQNRSKSSTPQQTVDPTSGESLRVLKSKKLSNNHKGRYIFKADGLIKKTISIQLEGHTHHLVAYYSLEDFCKGHLQLNEALNEIETTAEPTNNYNHPQQEHQQHQHQPPFDPQLMEILRQVPIPVDLMLQQNFRKPAALLASATTTASNSQNLMAAQSGEKLITALEYGAINPSDLQQQGNQNSLSNSLNHKKSSTFVPGGGIIFSSSPATSTIISQSQQPNHRQTRPRRHSSFHPLINHHPQHSQQQQQQIIESDIIDSLNLLDESSQLSGEALEFLSHFSDDQEFLQEQQQSQQEQQDTFNFLPLTHPQSPQQQEFSGDIETELFGSILSSSEDTHEDPVNAIRGQDVLLSDTIK